MRYSLLSGPLFILTFTLLGGCSGSPDFATGESSQDESKSTDEASEALGAHLPCKKGEHRAHVAPGCGLAARAICVPDIANKMAAIYCGCDGTTFQDSPKGSVRAYLHTGACEVPDSGPPQDTGPVPGHDSHPPVDGGPAEEPGEDGGPNPEPTPADCGPVGDGGPTPQPGEDSGPSSDAGPAPWTDPESNICAQGDAPLYQTAGCGQDMGSPICVRPGFLVDTGCVPVCSCDGTTTLCATSAGSPTQFSMAGVCPTSRIDAGK